MNPAYEWIHYIRFAVIAAQFQIIGHFITGFVKESAVFDG
jgi:hypothetical protein